MLKVHSLGEGGLELASDKAGSKCLYIYLTQDSNVIWYSSSLNDLLKKVSCDFELVVGSTGASALLQYGIVSPPKTVYSGVYLLSIGWKFKAEVKGDKFVTTFSEEFPFIRRKSKRSGAFNEPHLMKLLNDSVSRDLVDDKPKFLYHSAGKDSNSIALALAQHGKHKDVTFITQFSKNNQTESELSAKIAKDLGANHITLPESSIESDHEKEAVLQYFKNSPLPSLDTVSLGYPLHALAVPDLKGANVIDGMGNDVYMGHVPSKWEYRNQKLSPFLSLIYPIAKYMRSDSLPFVISRTRAECAGILRMSMKDAKYLYPETRDLRLKWKEKNSHPDYIDLRAAVRGVDFDQEVCIRKVRNFSDAYDCNLILPWCDEAVANYMFNLPDDVLFDREKLKNKLVLRTILSKRLGIDSDELGKMAFTVDSVQALMKSRSWAVDIIKQCSLWRSGDELDKLLGRLIQKYDSSHSYSNLAGQLFYRIFMMSGWFTYSKYSIEARYE